MVKKIDRTPVGAHYGWKDWLIQRITAVIMVIFSLVIGTVILVHGKFSYEEWKLLFASQPIRILTLLFFLSIFYHAWIGIRDVLMDYLKPVSIRLGLQTVVVVLLIIYTIWAISILWMPLT